MTNSCCATKKSGKNRPDFIFWIGLFVVSTGFLIELFVPAFSTVFTATIDEFLRLVWWGILAGLFFITFLNVIPRDVTLGLIGKPGSAKGILRATLAGVLFDLCSHGILLVGLKFYERGASLGQVMAFLIASPWNSISLTFILFALVGIKWTLLFILCSVIIAIFSGFLFDFLVRREILPSNPHTPDTQSTQSYALLFKKADWRWPTITKALVGALKESRIVIRWMLVGIIIIALVRSFMDMQQFESLFAPTLWGLFITLGVATIIEVCSEGLAPIASDLLNKAAAPGNAFTFLMAGVSTDYTEIMGLKETTKSWKIALFLPLVTVPQILILGYIMNQAGL